MLKILLLMAGGIILGLALRKQEQLVRMADKTILWSIFLLLFLMGLSMGANESIMGNLPSLGWQAMLLSIGGILGSILLACLLRRFLTGKKQS
jgi:uncharacterized membrane protein YbjE (DUF340 family)